MAILQDLISQIEDKVLRDRILQETNKLFKQKKFGLVFEEHLPECTPLYEVPIRIGSNVAIKSGYVKDIYNVVSINGTNVTCCNKETKEEKIFNIEDLVVIAQFGEPIYPYLKRIDSVCNAPDSDLWHTLIEADNYHALQLLEYLYAEKVDCIYIDPPYNNGATDWKYNNDYVDKNDAYRHSKWLSMMEKRLKIAKKLLNPSDSILMITIDDVELAHLKVLLEKIFSNCDIQIVDMAINPKGKAKNGRLSQVDEYLILVYIGNAFSAPYRSNNFGEEIRWPYLRRSDVESARGTKKGGIQQFYPIYIDTKTDKIVMIGDYLTPDQPLSDAKNVEGAVPVFPIRNDGKHMNWGLTKKSLLFAIENGCVRVSKSKNIYQPYNFTYVTLPSIKKALSGEYKISGKRPDGTLIITLPDGVEHQKPTSWKETHYDANIYGTQLIGKFLIEKRFPFPKSLYSVLDALSIYLTSKPNALVLDFFAGSGTTLHAVNLLNAQDNGKRRCILATNNEISAKETQSLIQKGFKPGDKNWEKYGIANYVTWPRTKCSIKGIDINGKKPDGEYGIEKEEFYNSKIDIIDEKGKKKSKDVYLKKKIQVYPKLEKYKFSDGFKANAIFFKLGFLDKTSVALGKQFKNLLSVLWMKAGMYGECPILKSNNEPDMLILPKNKFAVLINEMKYSDFAAQIHNYSEIETIYIVTDSENSFKEMIKEFEGKLTYQLYSDYLDNFRINARR